MLVAGCGGSGPQDAEGTGESAVEGTAPAVWIRTVCSSLLSWRHEIIEVGGAELRGRYQEAKTPVEARSAVVSYYADGVTRTDDLLRALDEAGSPAVEDGAKVAQAFRRGFSILRTAFAKAREQAKGLPVDPNDRENFLAMNERIAESLDPAGERMERHFDRMEESLKTPELDRVWRRTSECKRVDRQY
jgi:hypothetical protein